jgi:methionyl-tRNA formyltransferase
MDPSPALRIAWFGHDWGAGCLRAALEGGHALTRLFTDDRAHGGRCREVRALARAAGAPVRRRAARPEDMAGLAGEADLVVCAGYRWRIPVVAGAPRGVNVHPSLLPDGRGALPFPGVILRGMSRTGVTIHELSERLDEGPIVHQAPLAVAPGETYDSLSARSGMLAARLLGEVLADLDRFWDHRRPQSGGSWWAFPSEQDRTLPLDGPVAAIDRVARAFPPGGALARLDGGLLPVARATVWADGHGHAPGTALRRARRQALVAAADGYALLELAPPLRARALARRAWRAARR